MPEEKEPENPYSVPTENGFEVYPNTHGGITIRQESNGLEPDQFVAVSMERVDRLIQFLIAVRDEIRTDRADAASEAHDIRAVSAFRPGMDP